MTAIHPTQQAPPSALSCWLSPLPPFRPLHCTPAVLILFIIDCWCFPFSLAVDHNKLAPSDRVSSFTVFLVDPDKLHFVPFLSPVLAGVALRRVFFLQICANSSRAFCASRPPTPQRLQPPALLHPRMAQGPPGRNATRNRRVCLSGSTCSRLSPITWPSPACTHVSVVLALSDIAVICAGRIKS